MIPHLQYSMLLIESHVDYEVTFSTITYESSAVTLLQDDLMLPWEFVLSHDDVFDNEDVVFASGTLSDADKLILQVRHV